MADIESMEEANANDYKAKYKADDLRRTIEGFLDDDNACKRVGESVVVILQEVETKLASFSARVVRKWD